MRRFDVMQRWRGWLRGRSGRKRDARYTTDPRHWATHGDWAVESREEAFARSPDFARQFFDQLFNEFPELAGVALFLRCSEQLDDVYAFFDRSGGGLAVQIDPDLDYVVV